MPLIPELGPRSKKSPAVPVVVALMLAGGLAGGVLWYRQGKAEALASVTPAAAPPPPAPAAPPPPPSREDELKKAGLKHLSVRIDGPLETAVVEALGKGVGPAMTQVITRSLVWWVKVPGDLLRGDRLEALYQERDNEEPLVHAVRFTSGKHGKSFAAYRFQPENDLFARYYLPSGDELELRLQDSPMESYEQITSLLRDGRKHKGVDFKAAVGSPVKAPFDGTVTRKTWAFRGNGNCFELAESGGLRRKALFLHLAELPKELQVGRRVKKGEVIAASGNTGRSFAPHLHYQLMSAADQVIDPFESHRTFRKQVAAAQKPALEAQVRRFNELLQSAPAPIP